MQLAITGFTIADVLVIVLMVAILAYQLLWNKQINPTVSIIAAFVAVRQ